MWNIPETSEARLHWQKRWKASSVRRSPNNMKLTPYSILIVVALLMALGALIWTPTWPIMPVTVLLVCIALLTRAPAGP